MTKCEEAFEFGFLLNLGGVAVEVKVEIFSISQWKRLSVVDFVLTSFFVGISELSIHRAAGTFHYGSREPIFLDYYGTFAVGM